MNWFFYAILFLAGLGFGSFLNVVSVRFNPEKPVFDLKNIGGRSHCPYCRKTLHWYELVPLVSFFIQGGKCRSCAHKLSCQYPGVEFLSGLIFVAVPFFLFPAQYFLFSGYYRMGFCLIWILALLVLLLVSIIDFRRFLIPDGLIWSLLFLGLALNFLESRISGLKLFELSFLRHYALLFGWQNNIWLNHLFAALAASVFFALMFYLGKGKIMGGGDIKLGFVLGLLLGWPDILMVIFIAFLLGGIVGLALMLSRKRTMKDFLPFAPFLAVGVILTVFFGYQILNGYFSLIGL